MWTFVIRYSIFVIRSLASLTRYAYSLYDPTAVGLHKPHSPWIAPKRFYDVQSSAADTDLAVHKTAPTTMPPEAFYSCQHFVCTDARVKSDNVTCPVAFDVLPHKPIPDFIAQHYRRAYRAVVAYTDHNVGLMLAELDTLGFGDNTATVLLSDHGWSLGEHGDWCKQANWDNVAHVPLVVRVPWLPQSIGKRTAALVESVSKDSISPLCALAAAAAAH